MLIWILFFAGMAAAVIVGSVYFISRVYQLELMGKLTRGRGRIRLIVAAAVVLLSALLCYVILGLVNTSVIVIHALLVGLLLDLFVWLLGKLTSKNPLTISRNALMLTGLVLLGLILARGWYQAHHVIRTAYEVLTEKQVEPLRVVQLSDSHIGATFDGEGFARELAKVQAEQPDLIVVTGDFVDDDTSYEDMLRASEALGTLQAPYGVYFSFGNHDKGYYSDHRGYGGDAVIRALQEQGVKVLEDEAVPIGEHYYLIGRQDRREEEQGSGRASMEELVADLDPERFMIVLDHQPNDYDAQEASGVDLVLSGHTHGGQFWPVNRLGEWIGANDRTYGLTSRSGTVFVVSSGISDWALSFKTGCKSEYVVIDIRHADADTDPER